jgi:hypothetical protein
MQDNFPYLYEEYKIYSQDEPWVDWKELTDLYYCAWEKRPLGNLRYRASDNDFELAYKYLKQKKEDVILGKVLKKGDAFNNNGPMWRQALRNNKKDLTTYMKYINIINNLTYRGK